MVISLFKMTPRHSAEVLSGVPKQRKAVRCLPEKTHMLDKLGSRVGGREFNVKGINNIY